MSAGKNSFANVIGAEEAHFQKARNRLDRLFNAAETSHSTSGLSPATLWKKFSPVSRHGKNDQVRNAVDFYLRNNRFQTPNPPAVKIILELLYQATQDLHEALPYGRGNVLVRDETADGTEQAGVPFDLKKSASKIYLTTLAEHLFYQMPDSDDSEAVIRNAACALYTGSAACLGYASLLAALLAHRCAKLALASGEEIRIEVIDNPVTLANDRREESEHVLVRATFIAKNGNPFIFHCDPWAEMNFPVLQEHSQYQRGQSTAMPVEGKAYPLKLDALMQDVSAASKIIRNSLNFKTEIRERNRILKFADPGAPYSLTNSLAGFVVREQLDKTHQHVRLAPGVRGGTAGQIRPGPAASIISGSHNELVQLATIGIDVWMAHAMASFDEWCASLELPREHGQLYDALMFALPDGGSLVHEALMANRSEILSSIEALMRRPDMGGMTDRQWADVLYAPSKSGAPAILLAAGVLEPDEAVELVRRWESLLDRLPAAQATEVLDKIFGARFAHNDESILEYQVDQGMSGKLAGALLDLLPAHGIALPARQLLRSLAS